MAQSPVFLNLPSDPKGLICYVLFLKGVFPVINICQLVVLFAGDSRHIKYKSTVPSGLCMYETVWVQVTTRDSRV